MDETKKGPKGAKGNIRVLCRRLAYLESLNRDGTARTFILAEIEALRFAIECIRVKHSLTSAFIAEIEAEMALKLETRAPAR
jgi:hypothetical protein